MISKCSDCGTTGVQEGTISNDWLIVKTPVVEGRKPVRNVFRSVCPKCAKKYEHKLKLTKHAQRDSHAKARFDEED